MPLPPNALSSVAKFMAARDRPLRDRTDYASAFREFRWPTLDRFNWALDYFDPMAAGNDRPALRLAQDSGEVVSWSFADLSVASNRVANFLRDLGIRRGDRLLLMLGNERPLWEMLHD